MHFSPLILLNTHWLLLMWLWATCLLTGIVLPYRRDRAAYVWGADSLIFAIIGILALVAWLLALLGLLTV